MKNLKRFDEFSRDLNEAGYYSGSYANRGSYGYEPPSALGGFKDTFGQGKGLGDLFGAGGALSRDRANKPDINKGIASVKKNIKDRWSQKKGFVDHLMGKGGSPKSDGGDDGGSGSDTGSATRLKGSGTAAAAGAGAAAAAAATPSGGGSPQGQQPPTPASVPSGYGIATTDGRWKGLVNALRGVTPPPDVRERSSSMQGLPGGKISEIVWNRFWLQNSKVKDGDKFPLWIWVRNYDVVGDRGKVVISVDIDRKNFSSPQDLSGAEQIDDFWRKKGYQVAGPTKDVGGNNRSTPSKFALVDVYYDLKNPGALKSDLEQLIRKYI